MDKIVISFGKYIKERRVMKGLSQVDMAKKLNISQQAYGRYELGAREPSLQTALDIAELLDFDLGDFLNEYKKAR